MRKRSSTSSPSECDREPIHIPGAIQPHGALLAWRGDAPVVSHASVNVAAVLGRPLEAVLGQPLEKGIGKENAKRVQEALSNEPLDAAPPIPIQTSTGAFEGLVHRHAGATLLELEPARGNAHESAREQRVLQTLLMKLQRVERVPALLHVVADTIHALTDFERVMVYRFAEDEHGYVAAERLAPHLEPFLGLHYPASDIPAQARRLYRDTGLRLIPDARHTAARLVAASPDDTAPLDLSHAILRAVSPIHLEYMQHMGTRASMSVPLVVRGRLWGLVTCLQHSGPRWVGHDLRAACSLVGLLSSFQISALETLEMRASCRAQTPVLDELRTVMRGESGPILSLLACAPTELLSLVDARGAAVLGAEGASGLGVRPSDEELVGLNAWLDTVEKDGLHATHALPAEYPRAKAFAAVASGLLSISLPGAPTRRLVWFRPEQVATVSWGGEPTKPDKVSGRLHPRRSFALWKEEVRETSTPWSVAHRELGAELRRSAIEIDVERQVKVAQDAVQARDDLVAVVSHDLRGPLSLVQLQATMLLQGLSTGGDGSSQRLRTAVDRIQNGVNRMDALIHDLLDLSNIEAGRFTVNLHPADLAGVVEESMLLLRPLADRRLIRLVTDVPAGLTVLADRDRLFQVLSNLVGNALKFSDANDEIRLSARPVDDEIELVVTDEGMGIEPEKLPHLFDRYWKGHRNGRSGSGLGLYIAQGIINAHGGRIRVESQVNQGTTFFIRLPKA